MVDHFFIYQGSLNIIVHGYQDVRQKLTLPLWELPPQKSHTSFQIEMNDHIHLHMSKNEDIQKFEQTFTMVQALHRKKMEYLEKLVEQSEKAPPSKGIFYRTKTPYEGLSKENQKLYREIQSSRAGKKLTSMVEEFKEHHSPYRKSPTNSESNFEKLDQISFHSLKILVKHPESLQKVSLKDLVDLLKIISLHVFQNPETNDLYSKLFTDHDHHLLLYMKDLSLKLGQKLFESLQDRSPKKDELFFEMLRQENDLIWLAAVRNNTKSAIFSQNMEKSKAKSPDGMIHDQYNYEELIHISSIKIQLILKAYQEAHPSSWLEAIKSVLGEENLHTNLQLNRDFSVPYGRYSQAGEVTQKYIYQFHIDTHRSSSDELLSVEIDSASTQSLSLSSFPNQDEIISKLYRTLKKSSSSYQHFLKTISKFQPELQSSYFDFLTQLN